MKFNLRFLLFVTFIRFHSGQTIFGIPGTPGTSSSPGSTAGQNLFIDLSALLGQNQPTQLGQGSGGINALSPGLSQRSVLPFSPPGPRLVSPAPSFFSFFDGCNFCGCQGGGALACTLRFCNQCRVGQYNIPVGVQFFIEGRWCRCGSGGVIRCQEQPSSCFPGTTWLSAVPGRICKCIFQSAFCGTIANIC